MRDIGLLGWLGFTAYALLVGSFLSAYVAVLAWYVGCLARREPRRPIE